MICHNSVPTPFGEVAVLYHDNPFLLIEILLPRENRKNLAQATPRSQGGNTVAHQKVLLVLGSISDYFKGKPIQPPWAWMDLSRYTNLQRSVLSATADISYGQLRSYREIAEAIGRPRAYRFVGTTLAKNRFPILIPCHRVVKSDFSIGQFSGGADLKRKLIETETTISGLAPKARFPKSTQVKMIRKQRIHIARLNKL